MLAPVKDGLNVVAAVTLRCHGHKLEVVTLHAKRTSNDFLRQVDLPFFRSRGISVTKSGNSIQSGCFLSRSYRQDPNVVLDFDSNSES